MYFNLKKILFFLTIFIFIENTNAETYSPKKLTPMGSIEAGNNEGTIPSWVDNERGVMLKKITKEHVNFIIDINNYKTYINNLSAAQIYMLEQYPNTFKLYIYKSYRTQRAPQWLYDATEKNKTSVKLDSSGTYISDTWPGIPFPTPNSGIEVIWNHLLNWRGVYLNSNMTEVTVYGQNKYKYITNIKAAFYYYDKTRHYLTDSKILSYMSSIIYPASLAGSKLLVNDYSNTQQRPRQAWAYLKETRKTQRVPAAVFDNVISNSGGLRLADEVNMYNGSPELFNWTIVDKKEIFIPYNNQFLTGDKFKINDLIQVNHVDPSLIRNELHRVWVIEGKLKKGKSHLYTRRIFYIDEDSWAIVISENYNKEGQLWRSAFSHVLYYPSMPGVFSGLDIFTDFKRRAYFAQWFNTDEGKGITFSDTLPNKVNFTASALRRESKR